MDPVWLSEALVFALHDRLLAEHGGSEGLRDASLLESALARPRQLLAYGDPDIFDLAAGYSTGIIRNHPFVDGNKRTGFMTAYTFLRRNGYRIVAREVEVVQFVSKLAASDIDETAFARWLRENCETD